MGYHQAKIRKYLSFDHLIFPQEDDKNEQMKIDQFNLLMIRNSEYLMF